MDFSILALKGNLMNIRHNIRYKMLIIFLGIGENNLF